MHKILQARLTYPSLRPPTPTSYRPERGSLGEYQEMKRGCAEFRQALRRQLEVSVYNELYKRVEQYCRMHRPFKDKPHREWLGILQAVWSRALAGELPAMPYEFHPSGFRYGDLSKIESVTQETTVKAKKPIKQPKVKAPAHNIVGVRFLDGHNLQKVYSYTVPKKVKLHLGEAVVVPSNPDGFDRLAIAVVVALNHTPEYTGPLRQIHGRIATVKG